MLPYLFSAERRTKIITGGITDINGVFSIPVAKGTYDISIEYISFKTIKVSDKKLTKNENIGLFELEIDVNSLDEVEIIAEKTTVEIKIRQESL